MEDLVGASAVASSSAANGVSFSASPVERSAAIGVEVERAWLVGPWFDLLALANLWWLLAWLPDLLTGAQIPRLEFWQIYFLTTPHRWLTLLLVAADPDRRAGRRDRTFVLIAVGLGAAVLSIRGATGAFTCLLLVDYVWNAWHFASQHGGVLRMYARLTPGGASDLRGRAIENFCVRGLVLYVFFRLAGWSTGWLEATTSGQSWLTVTDYMVLTLPAILLARVCFPSPLDHGCAAVPGVGPGVRGSVPSDLPTSRSPRANRGRKIYTTSLCGLYASVLLALRADARLLVASLATAVAAFHAIEYLAVVTHYAERRTIVGSAGLFRRVARHWPTALALFVLACGAAATLAEPRFAEWWIGLNIWAALVHYSFDGMIWKLRRRETAAALGLAPSEMASAKEKVPARKRRKLATARSS